MPDSAGLEALFVRLYFDRRIMTRLAVDLRGRGYDVLTTEEAGKDTAADEECPHPIRHPPPAPAGAG